MKARFDPFNLTPAASLNRMPVSAVPGALLEAGVAGKPAYELLSREALSAEIRRHALSLGIEASATDDAQLPWLFDRCFESVDRGVRDAAEQLARRFGARLGALVLTLQRGDPLSRAARPDWSAAHWTQWAGIRVIHIGGGLAGGHLGPRAVAAANVFLTAAGWTKVLLHTSCRPVHLPLIGAARSVPPGYHAALVFDWGQTSIKRGYVRYDNDVLTGLHTLAPISTTSLPGRPDNVFLRAGPDERAAMIAELMAQTWRDFDATGQQFAPVLVCSMASYIAGNHPIERPGGVYGALHSVADNLGSWLGRQLAIQIGRALEVTLLHDGTAAARVYAAEPDSAVIMLGTALGSGFAPPAAGLRRVGAALQVDGA